MLCYAAAPALCHGTRLQKEQGGTALIGPIAIVEYMEDDWRRTIRALCGDDIELQFAASNDEADIRAAMNGADYVVVRGRRLDGSTLRDFPKIKLIHQWGTGVDAVPVDVAREMGIPVARCPGVNAPTVADLTIALMLSVMRRVPQSHAALQAGTWRQPQLWDTGRDLAGAEVGLVGYGAIAQAVARRLQGFDCKVRYWRRSGPQHGAIGEYSDFDDLLSQSDVLSLHIPLTNETRGRFGAAEFASMRPGAFLINTARGGLIDEPALVNALKSGHLAGAGLDVFDQEPVAAENPLLSMEQVIVQPHLGGRTRDNLRRLVQYWANNFRRHAAGEPIPPGDLV